MSEPKKTDFSAKKRIGKLLSILILWIIGITITVLTVWPILTTYLTSNPARGIDLYLTHSHVAHLLRNFSDPVTSWWYEWYGGRPFEPVYPFLHFYGILLFYKFASIFIAPSLTLFSTVQWYVAGSLLLFFIFCYTLFYAVSRNFLLALIPTFLTAFSAGLYTPIFWGGAVPYTSTMFFYPLILTTVYLFIHKKNTRWLYISGLLTGLSLYGHPQLIAGWVIPVASLMLLIKSDWKKGIIYGFKNPVIYILIALACGFRELSGGSGLGGILTLIFGIFQGAAKSVSISTLADKAPSASAPVQNGFLMIFRLPEIINNVPHWMHHGFFFFIAAALIIFLISLILYRKKWISSLILFFFLAFYGWFFMYLYYIGSNPFAGGWYRAFWGLTVLMGLMISLLFGESSEAIGQFINKVSKTKLLGFFSQIIFASGFLLIGWILYGSTTNGFTSKIASLTSKYGEPARYSSAYPITLNTHAKNWSPQLYKELVPSWLEPNRLDYRLYDMDATVNIWWNSIFAMPLARGYLDSPGNNNYAGWEYLMNITFGKDEAVKEFKMPVAQAKNQAQFFLDWHAIRYLEGGSAAGRNYGTPVSSYILDDMITQTEEVKIKPEPGIPESRGQALNYLEVKSNLVSPIYQSTKAPSILVIGNQDAQNTIMRLAAALNINSQKAIIVQGSEYIDDYSQEELQNFDMVFLYYYRYKSSRVWDNLENYVQSGGTLFIDTGNEGKESSADNLPAVFPITANIREPLEKTWALEAGDKIKQWDIATDFFTAPVFNGEPWSFSFAKEDSIEENTEVILSNYGKTIMAQQKDGDGLVIWSGMNFPYHALSESNPEEIKLFSKLIEESKIQINSNEQFITSTAFNRPGGNKVIIKGKDSKGVLFKEAAYPGWKAEVKNGNTSKNIRIFESGPMQPGYAYVIIPKEMRDGDFTVTFTFNNSWNIWLLYLINAIGIIITLDLITGKWIIGAISKLSTPHKKKIKSWWDKEEEY